MHHDHASFINSLHECRIIKLTFYSTEDRQLIARNCAPMDYGPSRRAKDQSDRYHFWDYDSDSRNHTLSLLPDNIAQIELTASHFDPAEFVTWPPQWFTSRNWGSFS